MNWLKRCGAAGCMLHLNVTATPIAKCVQRTTYACWFARVKVESIICKPAPVCDAPSPKAATAVTKLLRWWNRLDFTVNESWKIEVYSTDDVVEVERWRVPGRILYRHRALYRIWSDDSDAWRSEKRVDDGEYTDRAAAADEHVTDSLEASELGERRVQFDGDQTELVSLADQLVCNTSPNSSVQHC